MVVWVLLLKVRNVIKFYIIYYNDMAIVMKQTNSIHNK